MTCGWGQFVPSFTEFSEISNDSLRRFQSLPGSKNIVYIVTPSSTWTEYQRDDILYTLYSVSEDFRPFDVNITTVQSIYNATPTSNRLKYQLNFGAAGATGACWYDAFGQDSGCSGGARVAAHEIGHGMDSLTHDGHNSGQTYYTGNQYWFPIMGRNLEREYSTFGMDYQGSTNSQDDLRTLGELLGWREDDHSDSMTSASPLQLDVDQVLPEQNYGIISSQEDVDYFEFEITQDGGVDLQILPLRRLNNLHVHSTIFHSNGDQLMIGEAIVHSQEAMVNVKQGSRLRAPLDPGHYILRIENTGYEDSLGEGYTKYGSIGYYDLSGLAGDIRPRAQVDVGKGFFCDGEEIHLKDNSLGFSLDYLWEVKDSEQFTQSVDTKDFQSLANQLGIHQFNLRTTNRNGTSQIEGQFEVGYRTFKLQIDSTNLSPQTVLRIYNKDHDLESNILLTKENTNTQGETFEFCLNDDQYEIELRHPYEAPQCSNQEWKLLLQYRGGDVVQHKGELWKANYTQSGNEPGVGGSPWTSQGLCEYSSDNIQVKLLEDEQLIASVLQSEMGSHTNVIFSLSDDDIDIVVDLDKQSHPAEKNAVALINSSSKVQAYQVYSIQGELVQRFQLEPEESIRKFQILKEDPNLVRHFIRRVK